MCFRLVDPIRADLCQGRLGGFKGPVMRSLEMGILQCTGIFFLLFLSACVTTQQDFSRLTDQVVALNDRVTRLEEAVSEDVDSQLAPIRESQAETVSEIQSLQAEVQQLSGQVDENRRLVEQTVERDTTEQDVMKARLEGLEQRVAEMETELQRIRRHVGLKKAAVPEREPTEKDRPEAEPLEEKGTAISPEKSLYEESLSEYKAGNYLKAIEGFKTFIDRYPDSDLADNSQFWIGECHMSRGQFEKAILAYQEVIQKYGKGNKVPNAMLRQAMAFDELDDKTSTKLLLQKVVKQYPDSSEADIAREKLKGLED